MSDSDTDRESATFLPAEKDDDNIAATTTAYPPHHKENTEVIYGEKNVINWVVQTLHTVTKH